MDNLALIKKWESCKLKAYQDTGGVWTIGYGHTKDVKEGDTCTQQQAEEWLVQEANDFIFNILSYVTVPLNENQLAALTCFVYNIGSNAFYKSTMLKFLNQGLYGKAADEFPRWCKDNGKTVQGLLNRRLDEQKLFLTPVVE